MGPTPPTGGRDKINEGAIAAGSLAVGNALGDGLLAYFGTTAQNKALENAMARVRQQATTQVRQSETQANDARRARIRLQREAAGRLRVLRAGGLGGSFTQRGINLNIDAQRDISTISRNQAQTAMSIADTANNQLISFNNQIQDPLLAAGTAFAAGAFDAAKAAAAAAGGGA